MLGDRAGRAGRCRGTPRSRAARPRASSWSARSGGARSGRRSRRPSASPRSSASTSSVVSAYTCAQQRLAEVGERRVGEAADEPLQPDDADLGAAARRARVELRSSTRTPASVSTATISSCRFACQSWLPSTATTGIVELAAGVGEHLGLARAPRTWSGRRRAGRDRPRPAQRPAKAAADRARLASRRGCRPRRRSGSALPVRADRRGYMPRVPGYRMPMAPRRDALNGMLADAEALRRRRCATPASRSSSAAASRRWVRGGPDDRPRPRLPDQARGRRAGARRARRRRPATRAARPRSGSSRPSTGT